MQLLRDAFPDRPAFGTAVSDAILARVARGELGATVRLHRPGRELALSKQDRAGPGFDAAVAAGRAAGFEPVLRLAGGRAAAFHEGTLALAWARPEPEPARTTRQRFEQVASAVRDALTSLGIDARVGEIPGEYCPGAWSINARGQAKLVGIGQRLIQGAAHVGVVVVVSDPAAIRQLLIPVYEALELDWDPATVGALSEETGSVSLGEVEDRLLIELERVAGEPLEPARLDEETLDLAARLEQEHVLTSAGAA